MTTDVQVDFEAQAGYFVTVIDADGQRVSGVAKCSTKEGWALVQAMDTEGRPLPNDNGTASKTKWAKFKPPLTVIR